MLCLLMVALMMLNDPPAHTDASNLVPIIAHRGESHDAPENTLASFGLAWERGDDTVETDIHLTSDGQLLISHDPDTKRITGRLLVIKDEPLATLKTLDAGSWKDPKFAGEKYPTLDEVLNQMPAGKRIFVEIKIGPEAVDPLAKSIDAVHRPARDIVIISFNIDSVRAAKQTLKEHDVYFLVSQKLDKQTQTWTPTTAEMIAKAKDAGADGLDIAAKPCVDADLVKQVHAAGLKLLVWTVDEPEQARMFRDMGVDGITTNRSAWMRQQLQSDATK